MSNYEPHQQRVVEEKNELDEKREKLNNFLQGDFFKTIDENEQERLEKQADVMKMYSDVLGERIRHF